MANSELYLIRHGESDNISSDLIDGRNNEAPLTKRGVEQSRLLGKYFLENNIIPTRVFASPAIRTVQTANITLAAMNLGIEPTIAQEIQEMDQGCYVGRLRSEVYTLEVLAEIDRQGKDFKLPNGESINDVGARMHQWVEANIPNHTGPNIERIFVFGHGGAIKALASTIYNWSRVRTFESVTDNTSFTLFLNQDNRWLLQVLGATPHLDN